jgi:hypothetical protein
VTLEDMRQRQNVGRRHPDLKVLAYFEAHGLKVADDWNAP